MNFITPEEIGKRIKELRYAQGLTQEKLAEHADVSVNLIATLETVGRNLRIDTLQKLLSALDVELSTFFVPFYQKNNLDYLVQLLQEEPNSEKYTNLFIDLLKLQKKRK